MELKASQGSLLTPHGHKPFRLCKEVVKQIASSQVNRLNRDRAQTSWSLMRLFQGNDAPYSRTNNKFLLCVRNRIAHRKKIKGQCWHRALFSVTQAQNQELQDSNLMLTE